VNAAAQAAALIDEVRDDPARRTQFALDAYTFRSGSRRYLPYARAVVAFMGWQNTRGALNPLDHASPGSRWWRAVNEHLLRDTCEARLLLAGGPGEVSRPSVEQWLRFFETPTAQTFYLAHNASVVGGYLAHRDLAADEAPAERFFMNVTLGRVLYAQALVSDGAFALGRLALIGPILRNPRVRAPEIFLSMKGVLPSQYPIEAPTIEDIVAAENRLGRLLDYAVIGSRLDALYAFAADALAEPRLLGLVRDGVPGYAWPYAQRHVWDSPVPPKVNAALGFLTGPVTPPVASGSAWPSMAGHRRRPVPQIATCGN
jgi:hypothetical protein